MRRRLLLIGVASGLLLGWLALDGWRYRSERAEAAREIASGRFAAARDRLARLCERWPGTGETEFRLGECEEQLGNYEVALAAWRRVPPESDQALSAAVRTARLAMRHGRFALAEEALRGSVLQADDPQSEARSLLDQLDLYIGRLDDIRSRLRKEWTSGRGSITTLRKLWLLDAEALPNAAILAALENAGREAPDDDRVWLGRASLAIREGRLDEAHRWLRRCLDRRPADPDVWRVYLAWSVAAGHLDEAAKSLSHLTTGSLTPARRLELRARFAAARARPDVERTALEKWLQLEPGNGPVIERLAELASGRGDTKEASDLRRRKAEIDQARDRYRLALGPGRTDLDLRELARLAETLGRPFEAEGWWNLWARQGGDTDVARQAVAELARRYEGAAARSTEAERSLAGLLADLAPSSEPNRSSDEPRRIVPTFSDDAEPSGLRFTYDNARSSLRRLPETMGGGVGLIDYDGDGRLDVYAVQGGTFAPGPEKDSDGDRLFRGRGDGTFEDATLKSGIPSMPKGYGHGVTVGDYDNDGRPDLFITRWRSYALYHNRGDGTFEDATERSGLGGDRDWPTSAAFADLDNDGDLDLYVCHYLDWDPDRSAPCIDPQSQQRVYCVPRAFEAKRDHVFRNDRGRFVDVTEEAGLVDRDGRGLGVVAADIDDDGRIDLFVANDMTANFLFRNLGGFRFREEAAEAGVATNAAGGYQAGMGVAAGDLDGDGRIDLFVTNFYGESTTFYRNLGNGQFADQTSAVGLAEPSRYLLGFGIALIDANNDGWRDLATANGHVNDLRPAIPGPMPAQLLLGTPGGRLLDVSERAGAPWTVERLGRGLAAGDLDNDGRIDLLVLSQNSPLGFFHNKTTDASAHYATFQLEGIASNRDGVGARLKLVAGGRRQAAQRCGGGGFLSASDGRIHFGLGRAEVIDSLEVRWPSGRVDHYEGLPADQIYRVREGDARARPLVRQPPG